MDVVSAFLYGNFEEAIYMFQPIGYINKRHPDYVMSLEQNLVWFETSSVTLVKTNTTVFNINWIQKMQL